MRFLSITVMMLAAITVVAAAAAETASDIVAAADRVRNPGRPFRSTDTLTEYSSGKPSNQNVVTVFAKEDPATHQFRNLIRFDRPARDAGKMVLLDNRAFWFYDPASKSSVRISPQQRLTGQASVADVLTVNLALDYNSQLIGDETAQDADRKSRACAHLMLRASNPLATYNRIEYWVEKGSHYPIKAKFFSDSGRLLKTLYYRDFRETLGEMRPAEAVIIDAVSTNQVTTIDFNGFAFEELPESWFQRDYLPRVQPR